MKVAHLVSMVLALALFASPSWAQNVAGVDFIDAANITASASSEGARNGADLAARTVDGSNMDADRLLAVTGGPGGNQWHGSSPTPGSAFIQWDFDQAFKLKDMWLWNGNQPGWAHRSVQKADVYINEGGGYQLLTEYTFDPGPAHGEPRTEGDPEAPYAHDHYGPGSNEVPLGGRSLTGVRLEMNKPLAPSLPFGDVFIGRRADRPNFVNCCTGDELEQFATIEDQLGSGPVAISENADVFGDFSDYGGGSCCYVIEEVRFNIIPEPATFGLILAGIPLIMRRRRA